MLSAIIFPRTFTSSSSFYFLSSVISCTPCIIIVSPVLHMGPLPVKQVLFLSSVCFGGPSVFFLRPKSFPRTLRWVQQFFRPNSMQAIIVPHVCGYGISWTKSSRLRCKRRYGVLGWEVLAHVGPWYACFPYGEELTMVFLERYSNHCQSLRYACQKDSNLSEYPFLLGKSA